MSPTYRRRLRALTTLLATALAAVALGACGSDDDGDSDAAATGSGATVKVASQDGGGYNDLALLVADEQGFLKDHGIDKLEFVPVANLQAALAAVTTGEVDLFAQSPAVVSQYNAQSSGSKLQYIASMQSFDAVMLAKAGTDIPPMSGEDWESTVKAFEGKSIGVPIVGGYVDLVLRQLAEEVGLSPGKDFKIVAVGLGNQAAAAMKQGAVDVITDTTLGATQLLANGDYEVVMDLVVGKGPEQITSRLWGSGYFAPQKTLDAKPELYEGVAAAIGEAQDYYHDPANREEVEQFLVDRLEVTPAAAAEIYPRLETGMGLPLTAENVDPVLELQTELGMIEAPAPTFEDLVWERVRSS